LTFETLQDARRFLAVKESEILRASWLPPVKTKAKPITLREYSETWLAHRTLAPRTRELYRRLLDNHILPTFGSVPIASIKPSEVEAWHADLGRRTGPTATSHAYSLLRTITNTAVRNEIILASPCRIDGAGTAKRARPIHEATPDELRAITEAMPDRLALMVTLGAWCALRLGEIAALRRSDVDLTRGVLRIRHAVSWTDDGPIFKDPKTQSGARDVAMPGSVIALVREHLRKHAEAGRHGLLFPAMDGGTISEQTVRSAYTRARKKAGREDLRFHDLRHTGAVLAARAGATIADLQGRLGHSTPSAALRYQHTSAERDRFVADALDKMM
jgi:integrase